MKWLEYNDSSIKNFDVSSIAKECFGGEVKDAKKEDAWAFGSSKEKSKNAYMLVYEKKIKKSLQLVYESEDQRDYLSEVLSIEKQEIDARAFLEEKEEESSAEPSDEPKPTPPKVLEVDYYSFKQFIPSTIHQEIWEDNHTFMSEKHLYNNRFFNFVQELILVCDVPPLEEGVVISKNAGAVTEKDKPLYTKLMHMLSLLIIKLLTRAYDNTSIIGFKDTLRSIFALTPESALVFLNEYAYPNLELFKRLLTKCSDSTVRITISQLLLHAINIEIQLKGYTLQPIPAPVLAPKPQDSEVKVEAGPQPEPILNDEQKLLQFLDAIYGMIPKEVLDNWNKFKEYWMVREFAS